MRIRVLLLALTVLFSSSYVLAFEFSFKKKDAKQKEAEYIHEVLKQEEKEKYERKKLNYKPSGFMTVEEYESLSQYKDKSEIVTDNSHSVKESDMKYVPQPIFKIVRYNDPPGSPELNISRNLYKYRQYNGQGITAPDYSVMVYPIVYYYPNTASTSCDLFSIELDEKGNHLNKILNANAAKRVPIVSSDKTNDTEFAFRTLTPVDFSTDSKKLLIKEKLGSSQDGIWKTNAIVYDFETKTSYNLVELRDAIIYYWKENEGVDLDDKRWDIYPLGFLKDEPERVAAYAYAYTGDKPVFLGIWSIDVHGEQSRLLTFDPENVDLSINGFKAVQDSVEKPSVTEREQKAVKRGEKQAAKLKKEQEKADLKQMEEEYKAKIKEMDAEFKEKQKDYVRQQSIGGTTTFNEAPEKFKEIKIKELEKEIEKEEKLIEKEQQVIDKLDAEIQKLEDLRSIEPPQ